MKKNLSGYYEQYKRSTARTLSDVYGSWSTAKQNAYDWCIEKMHRLEGNDFRIISANGWRFTIGFIYTDAETGKAMFNVETADHSYEWEIKE